MVDAGCIAAAERLWRDYGCQCTAPSGERPNVLALAKLIQGYARAGSVEKATAFFHDACAHEAAVASAGRSGHLTGLLNVVLRSSTRGIAASGPVPARHDLVLLQIAARFQVPFDTATYNVLFAGLSQEAHVRVSSAHAAPPRLDNIAQAMHGLYGHMAERDVAPDDVSVAHLLPMWVVLGRMDLARVLWRRCAGGRPPGTTAQLRGHVLAQARRWGVADRIQLLVGAP
ncbi:hypothetical protein H4R21_000261 [Coemansia helicoidea]|uniref:Uncharacterized protein n=1 Tax=Coemansia helicoidea TaxID=1286919 RepID=A0ACC1LFY8_9FUNG|nr:hypothetical protein H4R21_000261 [Coemansia helicoidea]